MNWEKVKSGKTGTLKSLHYFMHMKNSPLAVRINSDLPSVTPVDVKLHANKKAQYPLLSLPFYLLGQLERLVNNHLR